MPDEIDTIAGSVEDAMGRHAIDSSAAIKDFLAKLPNSVRPEVYSRLLFVAGKIEDVINSKAADQVASLFGGRDRWDSIASIVRVSCLLDFVFTWPFKHTPEQIARVAKARKVDPTEVKKEAARSERDFSKAAERWRNFRASKMRNEDLSARIDRISRDAIL